MRITGGVPSTECVDLDSVDLFDPEFHATGDPHAVWAAMRARAPLHRQTLPDGRAFWSVTRYDDACRVLGDHRAFTSERGSILTQLGHDDVSAGKMLVSTDPPRHSELRRPIARKLTPRALASWEARIRKSVLHFLAPGLDGGVWDVAQRAYLLPMTVAGALMGVPESDWEELVRWTGMAAAPADGDFAVGSEAATLAIGHHQLFEYFAARYRALLSDGPGEDLISHLMTMDAGGAKLTEGEVVYNCYSLLLGANATTPHTVSGTLLALAEREDQFRKAAESQSLIGSLVEEGLRWTSPASSFLRHAVAEVELSGGRPAVGDAVGVWVGSANRDATVFDDPYHFDVTRADNRHIAFGHGPHYCLGATLARVTFRILFEEFFRLFRSIEAEGPPEHLRSVFIAGMTRFPVVTRSR